MEELETPEKVMARHRMAKAVVIASDDVMRLPLLERLLKVRDKRRDSLPMAEGIIPILHGVEVKTVCTSCYHRYHESRVPTRVPVKWRAIGAPLLQWIDIPSTHTLCGCTDVMDPLCEGDKRLINTENVPLESDLVALVQLPRELMDKTMGPSGPSGDLCRDMCGLFILDDEFPFQLMRCEEVI